MANRLWFFSSTALLAIALSVGSFQAASATPISIAQSTTPTIYIDRQDNESYEQLLQRVMHSASSFVMQEFSHSSRNRVLLSVIAQNGDLTAPILSVDVFRSEWESAPDIQHWARYLGESHLLLGFEGAQPTVGRNMPVRSPNSNRNSPPSRHTVISREVIIVDDSTTTTPVVDEQPEPSIQSDREIERFSLPSFPRRSNRLRITENGSVLEVETIQP